MAERIGKNHLHGKALSLWGCLMVRDDIGVPVDDDYIYEEFGIAKPKDYDLQKKKMEEEAERKRLANASQPKKDDDHGDEGGDDDVDGNQSHTKPIDNQTKGNQAAPSNKMAEKTFFTRLRDFFSDAPHRDGALEW